jgi:hypothetical protein
MQNLSLFADLKVILATYWFGIEANFKIIPLAGNDGPTRRDSKKLLESGDQLKGQNGKVRPPPVSLCRSEIPQ